VPKNLRSTIVCLGAAIAGCALVPAVAAATRVEWSGSVSLKTPIGTVSCASTPSEPSWAEYTLTAAPMKLTATLTGASALRCETASYGEVEVSGTGYPWHLSISTRTRKGTLKGTKKLGLEVSLASLPGAKCLYETANATATLTGTDPPVITLNTVKVTRNKASFSLCPAGGSFGGSLTLP